MHLSLTFSKITREVISWLLMSQLTMQSERMVRFGSYLPMLSHTDFVVATDYCHLV